MFLHTNVRGEELKWSVQSPDLNSSGHMWDELAEAQALNTVSDLTNALMSE